MMGHPPRWDHVLITKPVDRTLTPVTGTFVQSLMGQDMLCQWENPRNSWKIHGKMKETAGLVMGK